MFVAYLVIPFYITPILFSIGIIIGNTYDILSQITILTYFIPVTSVV